MKSRTVQYRGVEFHASVVIRNYLLPCSSACEAAASFSVSLRVRLMPLGSVSMMGGLLMVTSIMMLRRVFMVLGGLLVMLGSLPVRISSFLRHGEFLSARVLLELLADWHDCHDTRPPRIASRR